jgi:hypothetical protein
VEGWRVEGGVGEGEGGERRVGEGGGVGHQNSPSINIAGREFMTPGNSDNSFPLLEYRSTLKEIHEGRAGEKGEGGEGERWLKRYNEINTQDIHNSAPGSNSTSCHHTFLPST